MIEYYYSNRTSTELKKIDTLKNGTWIRAFNLTPEDLEFLNKETSLTNTEIAEAIELFEVPRIEREDGNIHIYLRAPGRFDKSGQIISETILLMVTNKHIVTITADKNPFIKKILKNRDLISTQLTKFVFELLHTLVEEYADNILAIHNKIQHRFTIDSNIGSKYIKKLLEYEQLANLYQSALVPITRVTKQLARGRDLQVYIEDEELLGDVLAEAEQALDIATVTRKLIVSLRDSYQIIFTNTLNNNVQLLAGITIMLTVPTIFAGLWGMNVSLPLANNPNAFMYIMGGSILVAILIFLLFRKKRWV